MNLSELSSERSWSDQLFALEQQLKANADSEWLVHVRIKTLRFLISRYGDMRGVELGPVPNGDPYYASAPTKWEPGTIKETSVMRDVLDRIRERWRA